MRVHKAANKDKYQKIINDIHRYNMYFETKGMDSSYYYIHRLPLNLGYDDHPYWLIEKINFILRVTNKIYSEMRKRGS